MHEPQQSNVVPSQVEDQDDVEMLDLDGMFATPPPISESLRSPSGPREAVSPAESVVSSHNPRWSTFPGKPDLRELSVVAHHIPEGKNIHSLQQHRPALSTRIPRRGNHSHCGDVGICAQLREIDRPNKYFVEGFSRPGESDAEQKKLAGGPIP